MGVAPENLDLIFEWSGNGKYKLAWGFNFEDDAKSRAEVLKRWLYEDKSSGGLADCAVYVDADDRRFGHLKIRIPVSRFIELCTRVGWNIPERLRPAGRLPHEQWPWGKYETEMLRHLDAAARKWWVNYEPADPTTAPTNAEVTEWLQKECRLTQNKADAIATILRADGLTPGPRR